MDKKLIALEEYKTGNNKLLELLNLLSDKEIEYFPGRQDAWSIKEHIIHLIDSEINGFIRLKSIIAQPSSDCYVMNEEEWTKNLRTKNEDVHKYLSVFKLIRELAYDFIIEEDPLTWNTNYFIRTYKGETINVTIEKWLDFYNYHLKFHIDFINNIYQEINTGKKEVRE